MKRSLQNTLKVGAIIALMLSAGAVSAQQVTGAFTKIEDTGKSKELNGTIRVIDNKGTKKFLQVKNGLTLLTDQAPDGGITSTWQLGGALSDNTYIDATGHAFSLDGLELVTSAKAAPTSTSFSVGSNAATISGTAPTVGPGATDLGWTVLIRDEATGKIQKILASDFISSGVKNITVTDGAIVKYAALGLAANTVISKVSVYRNGAKLRATDDYIVSATDEITLIPSSSPLNDWALYVGDLIEIQWIN
jgi:hypothetical protein